MALVVTFEWFLPSSANPSEQFHTKNRHMNTKFLMHNKIGSIRGSFVSVFHETWGSYRFFFFFLFSVAVCLNFLEISEWIQLNFVRFLSIHCIGNNENCNKKRAEFGIFFPYYPVTVILNPTHWSPEVVKSVGANTVRKRSSIYFWFKSVEGLMNPLWWIHLPSGEFLHR